MRKMNIVSIPFHDWRKILKEGFRTRDAHIIKTSLNGGNVVLVVNRPTTLLEILIKKKGKIIGKKILSEGDYTLYQVENKLYVIDYVSNDIFKQIFLKHKWFIIKYQSDRYIRFINKCINHLNIRDSLAISHNIFSGTLLSKIDSGSKVFDAFDNVIRFPFYKSYKRQIDKLYKNISRERSIKWITNSNENRDDYLSRYKLENVDVVINGANTKLFSGQYSIPDDLKDLPRPWIGFGGKITHLFDYELFNFLTMRNEDKSFIIVGQIIDHVVFDKIYWRSNVKYLGDKKYENYVTYASNFDVAIIPYHVSNKAHGGSSIKAFEFMAARKKTIGTIGNGLEDLSDYIYLTNDHKQFSEYLKTKYPNKLVDIKLPEMSWESRFNQIISITI
jgi:teichuronic acid biosynthesis glycosyltransferase TuaH